MQEMCRGEKKKPQQLALRKSKNIDRLLFTDGPRDEVQLRGEAVLSAERSI